MAEKLTNKELLKQAEKTGTLTEITVTYLTLDKPGVTVEGRLLAGTRVKAQKGKGTYIQYLFATDAGNIKVALGGAFDNEYLPMLHRGGVYRIVFKGKQALAGGHQVNRFQVWEIDIAEADAEPLTVPVFVYEGDEDNGEDVDEGPDTAQSF